MRPRHAFDPQNKEAQACRYPGRTPRRPALKMRWESSGREKESRRSRTMPVTAASFIRTSPARQITGMGRSEEHTSELQSLMRISYAVFCLKTKKNIKQTTSDYVNIIKQKTQQKHT